ncbi:hypothetical protein SARC_06078 [Sphaeroforma arctica JP610]|uniref:Thioredoxin domain-containing protein n=1 Tax=Sphaeroforma arctica JP610 TaxID=667725 RepID=A0A0L0FXQ0_9EUKA|nr:hypothetical protein SARC_06078 [Sphaeroforma arctica JP610]KNC81600.1 hypothetical protein SARC_06078 [Sphaeroforma arctica JP610]|eukprot:XP_014155502.1 hypothetical protein SARC_06078 [Sphaeroforma arctica JP610]
MRISSLLSCLSTAVAANIIYPTAQCDTIEYGRSRQCQASDMPIYNSTAVWHLDTPKLADQLTNASAGHFSTPYTAVYVHTEWCPYSIRSFPVIKDLSRVFPHIPVVAIDVMEENARRWVTVVGVPAILIYDGIELKAKYSGTRSLQSLTKFVQKKVHHTPQNITETPTIPPPMYTHKPSLEGVDQGVGWALFVIVAILVLRWVGDTPETTIE